MKKIITLLFTILTMPLYSQWVQQNSGTSEFLNDVYCISENVVVVVGANGTILKTVDGGAHWIQKMSGTSNDLNKMHFINSNIGYATGSNGTLLKTTDAGENWSSITTNLTTNLTGLFCLNESTFFIGEDYGYIRKTSDGGFSFEILNFGTVGFLDNVQFFNEMTGYANSYDVGLLKTTDGGNSWSIVQNDVFSFFFLNEDVGFVNSNTGLQKTIDGGLNFTYLSDISFVMHKLFAPTENIVWGVTKDFLLGGLQDYTMRGEINNLNEYQMTVSNNPLFDSIYFSSATMGYGVVDHYIFKNSTGLLLAVPQIDLQNKTKIYPNPTSDQIKISLDKNQTQPFSVEIKNCLGEIIFSEFYQEQNFTVINVESLSKGVYFLTIIIEEKRNTQKVIVN